MKIQCLGAGVMSSAFAHVQALNHEVWVLPTEFDQQIIDGIRSTGVDQRFQVDLPARLTYSKKVAVQPNLLVVGVSSIGIDWALEQCRRFSDDIPLLLLTKGLIESDQGLIPIAKYVQSSARHPVYTLTGPCIAQDLANGSETFVELSGTVFNQLLANELSIAHMHVAYMPNLEAACWLAALKNVYAMIVAANSATPNLKSSYFTRAVAEMSQWLSDKGIDASPVCLSGIGDLLVTIDHGRNGRFGRFIAQGYRREEVLQSQMRGVTVEGLKVLDDLKKNEDLSRYPLISEFITRL
ncbi:hypothetical protein OAT84_02310 [Gammaproteobacteria bacterium]|nr:hypothetical protein [Gammaproteobacteria bacterium]